MVRYYECELTALETPIPSGHRSTRPASYFSLPEARLRVMSMLARVGGFLLHLLVVRR